MDISKESLLGADDSKTRDAILFDMMKAIVGKLDVLDQVNDRVDRCENSMATVRGIGIALSTLYAGLAAWIGLK